jgi:hydroxymethylpyrimidine pyrophosphatase-like HAD family hydrolase
MQQQQSMIIAVDFDGTIVDDAYPGIGKPKMFAFQTLKKMQENGHRLILWTYRHGKRLNEAVAFCEENGITFYAVNRSFPEEESHDKSVSRKIHADLFIDDRNFGGFPGWGEIYHDLFPEKEDLNKLEKRERPREGFFGKLLGGR